MSKPKAAFAVGTGIVSFGKVDPESGVIHAIPYSPVAHFEPPVSTEPSEPIEFNLDALGAELETQLSGVIELSADEIEDLMRPLWGYMKLNGIWVEVLRQPKQLEDGSWSIEIGKQPLHPEAVKELRLEKRIKAAHRE